MSDIRIDTSSLTYTQFLIPGLNSEFIEGANAPTLSLEPGVYSFQQGSGLVGNFSFKVTPDGLIDYDIANEGFLSGRGTSNLTVRGFTITLDARALSHDLLPLVAGASVLPRDRIHELAIVPAVGYSFQPGPGIVADFQFGVTVEGQVAIDPRYAGFAAVDGRTLTINGYRITIDGRELSHDLLPLNLFGNGDVLARSSVNELTYIPSANYSFQPGPGIVADFQFGVTVEGQVVIDPRYAGFAAVSGRTLTISGYRITIDGRALSHDLLPLSLFGNGDVLSRDTTHELTYIPAASYGFQPGPGIVADFQFGVTVEGQVVIDPRYAGFAAVDGRTLTINGYRITIDGRELSHDLLPLNQFGNGDVLSRDRVHELSLIPASAYVLRAPDNLEIQFRIKVDTNGGIGILDVPGGLILTRPVPPPATLRAFYAGFFLPDRGSLREFCKPTREIFLRGAIRDHRKLFFNNLSPFDKIDDLFSGGTSEEEEDEALNLLLGCSRADDLIDLVNKLTWDRLDDELDESDLTQIMDRLKVLLDRRDYLIGFLLRWFFLVENERLPSMDSVNNLIPFATSRTTEVRHSVADQSLNQRDAVLDGLALMALRGLPTFVGEFKLILDTAAGSELYRTAELQRLSWEVFYTDLICTQLARGEYHLLQKTLTDLFNDQQFPFPVRNVALFNMLRQWDRHFVAMERLISILGSERQKADVRRYMETRKLFMDNFPVLQQPPAPPTGFLAAIQQAIQSITTTLTGVAGTFQDLVGAVQAIVTTIDNISAPDLLGANDDDMARAAVNTMSTQGLLSILPALYKVELINKMLDGPTLDEDENAILTILRETKTRSPAEFLQLTASATWEALDTDFNGEQYDQLEALFRF
jgi:hypothetical protein